MFDVDDYFKVSLKFLHWDRCCDLYAAAKDYSIEELRRLLDPFFKYTTHIHPHTQMHAYIRTYTYTCTHIHVY